MRQSFFRLFNFGNHLRRSHLSSLYVGMKAMRLEGSYSGTGMKIKSFPSAACSVVSAREVGSDADPYGEIRNTKVWNGPTP